MNRIALIGILCLSLVACGNASNNIEEVTGVDEQTTLNSEVMEEETILVVELDKQEPLIIVIGDVVNVRDMPTVIGSQTLGVVLEDSVYVILDESVDEEDQDWYKINYDTNSSGWIAGWLTEAFDNPNNYMLASDEWRDYNRIHKSLTKEGEYKVALTKEQVNRRLIYDFDKDGVIDRIDIDLTLGETQAGAEGIIQSVFKYRDQTLVFDYIDNGEYGWGLTEMGVIDVIQSDQTVEFYVKEGDLADRVIYSFYQIDQGALAHVTTMYGYILGNSGDGKLYYWGGQLMEPYYGQAFNPDMVISYYDMDQKAYVTTEQIVGKTFTLQEEIILYKEYEDVIDGGPLEYDLMLEMTKESRVALLDAGDLLTVVAVDTSSRRAQISSSSGYEGWIGGFHMVWD